MTLWLLPSQFDDQNVTQGCRLTGGAHRIFAPPPMCTGSSRETFPWLGTSICTCPTKAVSMTWPRGACRRCCWFAAMLCKSVGFLIYSARTGWRLLYYITRSRCLVEEYARGGGLPSDWAKHCISASFYDGDRQRYLWPFFLSCSPHLGLLWYDNDRDSCTLAISTSRRGSEEGKWRSESWPTQCVAMRVFRVRHWPAAANPTERGPENEIFFFSLHLREHP